MSIVSQIQDPDEYDDGIFKALFFMKEYGGAFEAELAEGRREEIAKSIRRVMIHNNLENIAFMKEVLESDALGQTIDFFDRLSVLAPMTTLDEDHFFQEQRRRRNQTPNEAMVNDGMDTVVDVGRTISKTIFHAKTEDLVNVILGVAGLAMGVAPGVVGVVGMAIFVRECVDFGVRTIERFTYPAVLKDWHRERDPQKLPRLDLQDLQRPARLEGVAPEDPTELRKEQGFRSRDLMIAVMNASLPSVGCAMYLASEKTVIDFCQKMVKKADQHKPPVDLLKSPTNAERMMLRAWSLDVARAKGIKPGLINTAINKSAESIKNLNDKFSENVKTSLVQGMGFVAKKVPGLDGIAARLDRKNFTEGSPSTPGSVSPRRSSM